VIELGGIGPAPFAAMMLADLGADVVRIDRPTGSELFPGDARVDILNRGKRSAILDLKRPEAVTTALDLVAAADVLIEGFRPGVTERLGLGPEACWERNPRLVYARMTGWGQSGPLAHTAGHDITYIAITGALGAIGDADGPPQIPLNLVGDFGGGGAYLVIGILAALHEVTTSGLGQVVDGAIVDGAAHLLASTHALLATGTWRDERGVNLLDGGAPFYSTYATADRQYVAVGALENRFYRALIEGLEVDLAPDDQNDRATWPKMCQVLTDAFASRPLAHWVEVFSDTDACVAPVTTLNSALKHPHVAARQSIVERDGVVQPGTAPRFSRTQTSIGRRPPTPGAHTLEVLREFGVREPDAAIADGVAIQT
jgi:alpha-methylacyl-CoA racemase